jgi:hypothetical protein
MIGQVGGGKKKADRTFISPEGRLVVDQTTGKLLRAYGEVYGSTVREAYQRCFAHKTPEPWGEAVRKELVGRGWREDEADSIYDTAKAAQDSAVEATKLARETARASLVATEKKLEWAMAGSSKKRVRQRHGLARRRDLLQARVARFEARLAENDVRVFFGGHKLALAGNDPVAHGYESRGAWREVFDRARSNTIYLRGDTESSFGNWYAKVVLHDGDDTGQAGQDVLRLRIPDLKTAAGVALRELSGGAEWVEVRVEGLSYGREGLTEAQVSHESASEARARWEADRTGWEDIPGWRDEAKTLAQMYRGYAKLTKTKIPAWVSVLPKDPPRTPYKAKRASKPVSVRIFWRERKAGWYVTASVERDIDGLLLKPSRALRRRFRHALGVDVNPDHLAWCLIDKEGNPHLWGKIGWDLSGTSGQNADEIGRAVAKLVALAKAHGAPIAHEELDFTRKRGELRYMSRRLARLLSAFAYSKFAATLASRCAREHVHRISVEPAYSSVLGQANYAGVYGVSVDQGAACVIGRRALGLRTSVRGKVARQVPRCGSLGHTPTVSTGPGIGDDPFDWAGLKLVAKALSSGPHKARRRSTWDPSGLCLRRHSALFTGPLGKGETSGDEALSPVTCSPSAPNLASASNKAVLSGGAVAAARTRGRMPSGEEVLESF